MTFPAVPPASLRLCVDRQAVGDNWRALDAMSGRAKAGAAVKANAYGLGIDQVMPALRNAGADSFFVAHWSEVADVLAHSAADGVAVLHGVSNFQEASYAKATGAVPVINSLSQARVWNEVNGGRCHLMVDTGMNRLGVDHASLGDPAIAALQVDTLMSHLASADEDSDQNAQQLTRFREVIDAIEAKRSSLANSAGIALGEEYHFDETRPGLSLYGGVPRAELVGAIRPAFHIEAAVLQVRDLQVGDSVGYNAKWTASEPTRVATISLGYADGILRQMGAVVALQHGGEWLQLLGKVSMDMVIVNCGVADVKEGDFCLLSIDLPQVSSGSGLSQYEILTVLGQRFNR